MPRDMCPHYPTATGTGTTMCRACGVQISVSATSAVAPRANYPGTKAAAGTAMNAASTTGAKLDGKHH